MYNEVVKLISVTKSTNEYGDTVETRTERSVFVERKSITQSEFYQAEAVGFKPEIKFVLADQLDYAGEKFLKYRPYAGVEEEYTVIRTYATNKTLELVCKRGVDE